MSLRHGFNHCSGYPSSIVLADPVFESLLSDRCISDRQFFGFSSAAHAMVLGCVAAYVSVIASAFHLRSPDRSSTGSHASADSDGRAVARPQDGSHQTGSSGTEDGIT